MNSIITIYSIVLTIILYMFSLYIARKFPSPLTAPVFISTILLISGLKTSHLTYHDFSTAKHWITSILGPATIALAIPLYKNRRLINSYLSSIGIGIVLGTSTTITTALLLAYCFRFPLFFIKSFSVKSITIPVASAVAKEIGADPVLVGALVMITGMMGAMFGPFYLKLMKVTHPVARGLSIGTISHGIGTSAAVKEGDLQGAVSGIGMGLSAILTSILVPFLFH
ncbi:LrgB family protein [Heyndrickxia acidicola]|uniref:LrgB family protein n=1 Tax=Heyndrickxia acidicola TaxID=209389 RepID=A0ABU6MBD7_9BACI|nr:LrgB family protein [Heyndrickxia acidicola]MED1201723.1 LrgB family protein [Heyndrickxia acidicola]